MKTKFLILTCIFSFLLLSFASSLYAQNNDRITILENKILSSSNEAELYNSFEELTDEYFKDDKYNQYVEILKSLAERKKELSAAVNYYTAITRYTQLKNLEEKQDWNEYFNKGNEYRKEIQAAAEATIDKTSVKEPVNILARLVLWRLHKDQDDVIAESLLSGLFNALSEYSKNPANILLIKDVADQLQGYGEKAKAKELYKIYVDKLILTNTNDEELVLSASNFYKEGNLDLAQALYDVYIEKAAKTNPKENLPVGSPHGEAVGRQKLTSVLIDIAKQFSCDSSGQKDLAYAEKIFKKIEEIAGYESFDESLIYLRALNLEKAKEYNKAKDIYLDLINRFSKGIHFDEAVYKIGVIYVYVLRDLKTGRDYFEKLERKETAGPEVISSLYQLGLLSQWSENFTKAEEYYNKLIDIAKEGFAEKVALTKSRLEEVDNSKPLDYNTKMFLDASLKEENSRLNMAKLDLRSTPYNVKNNESVNLSAAAYAGEAGCMQPELQYLWSGDLGSIKPEAPKPAFEAKYSEPGVKLVSLVVVSPQGVLDRSIELIDVR